ncbi:MAG: hypothetical protein J6J13_03215, partial [Clostridia bacterium]|nr:hypothetical protein [Clostridia bacterium]
VSVQGEGFEGGTVWVYGLDKEGNGMFTAAKTTSINDTTANAIISEKYRFGMYLVWVESADGILSRPVRVNAPELTWIGSDTVAPGQEVYLYGKNLTKDNVDGNSNVYITNGTSYYKAEISDVNAYRISVTIPSGLADGNYKIWVHNGHGCSYGWSNGLSFAVEADSEDFWASGTTHTVTQVSGVNGLLWKINYTAKDGDTIYLKNGTYEISSIANTSYNAGIVVKKALRFVGESRDGVKIVSSMKNSSGTFVSGSNCMAIAAFPSEFQNITFVDNVNDFGTDNANIAGVYSTFLKAWGYLALYSSLGNKNVDSFKIDNCSFVVNRLRHSKSADTTDSQIDAALKEKYDYYAGAGVGWTSPLTIDAIKNVEITNCHFESSIGFMCYSAQKVLIEGCTSAGNWIEYGNSDSAFCYLQYCKNIDVSRNEIHGKDYYTDPDGKLERYDLGFGRGIVIQNTYASTDATYIAENDVRRCGEFDGGSGEQILYENLHTIYCGSINGISSDGKTVTLGDSVWEKQDDGSYAYRVNTSVTKVVIGTRLWVFGGKGESQYRTVVGVTADNNVILDRPFDVELATAAQENPSLVCITYANENAVVFRNYCEGPEDYDDNFNSTIGVQLYATMLDFIGAENLFTQMHQGFYLDAHYNFDLSNRFGYNGYEETIIINNTIHDVRIGVECTVAIFGLTDSILDGTPNPANLIHNVMIRGNEISETVLCENWLWASNGDYYNSLEKSGATCVMVGVTDDAVKYGNTVLWPGDWIRNTVIENNDFANAEMALMRIGYYQCGTVVRNNYCQGRGDEDDTILYDGPEIDVELEINRATVINDYGTEAEGVYGTVANLESFDEFMNPDFSEGFKYWGSNNGQGYACDHARLVTEGTETYLEMADSIGITSVDFKPKNIPVNSKVAVVYDWKGSENVKVELAGYGLAGGSFEKTTFTNSDVADGWNRSITSYALTTTQDLDFNVVINSLIHKQKSYVRNIEFVIVYENQGYYETADGRKYNLLDGSEYGGSETKGIQTLNSEDIHKYGPTLGIANNSFEDGLKFWKLSGTATDTISAADGQLVFSSTASANGVISAPFKVQQGAYKDNSANNRVAIILDYVCLKTTSSYYTVYLYESKNGAAPTRYKLTWDTGFKTIDAQT